MSSTDGGPARTHNPRRFLPRESLGTLVSGLAEQGYTVIGPVCVDQAITLRPIRSADQIPQGLKDEQDGGHYRLVAGDPELCFEYVVGPDSPKRYFFPPEQSLFDVDAADGQFDIKPRFPIPPKLAFVGVRPCELAAIAVQDRIFGSPERHEGFRCESNPYYEQTRAQAFLAAVNCTRPSGTCFCASWGTGPEVVEGQPGDLAMTELRGGFVVQARSPAGQELLESLPVRDPSSAERELAELKIATAREHMGRHLETGDVKDLLAANVEHPRWEQVAKRCLGCGNCTMACPTCFCSTVTDSNDIATGTASRRQQWESCYTLQFSYTTGGPVRNTIRARYRHWLRHKVSTWWDQFGTSGCVGCGRCITWCPVGIDLTEEIPAIREGHSETGRDTAAHAREAQP